MIPVLLIIGALFLLILPTYIRIARRSKLRRIRRELMYEENYDE